MGFVYFVDICFILMEDSLPSGDPAKWIVIAMSASGRSLVGVCGGKGGLRVGVVVGSKTHTHTDRRIYTGNHRPTNQVHGPRPYVP